MDHLSHPRTPKESAFAPISNPTLSPGIRCAESAVYLSEALSRVTGQCNVDFQLTNPSVIRTLGLIRKQVSDGFYLASGRRRGLSYSLDIIAPGSKAGNAVEALADIFDQQKERVDGWMYTFIPHVRAAQNLTRLLGQDADTANSELEKDLQSLSSIVRIITDADNAFASEWTSILESHPQGLRAYSTILKKHWVEKEFEIKTTLSDDPLDPATILHCDRPMEKLGREWTSRRLAETTTKAPDDLRSVEAQIRDVALKFKLPLSEKDLADVNLPISTVAKWSEITQELQEDSRKSPLRVCCFGGVKQGKSSFINSLIGKVVLEPGAHSTTAWPVLVRHVPDTKDPVLRINAEHFSPYLEFLRRAKFAQTYDERTLRWYIDVKDVGYLKRFEDTNNPFAFPPFTSDPGEVRKLLFVINRLMRLCWRLASDATFPALKNTQFPLIEIEFESLKGKSVDFEILDLPGLNESGTTMPEHVMDQALRIGVHGCVLICNVQMIETNGTTKAVSKASKLTNEPVIAVYGSRAEKWPNGETTKTKIAKDVWQSESVKNRVALGAPGLYVSARDALRVSFDTEDVTGQLKKNCLDCIWAGCVCRTAILDLIKFAPSAGGYGQFDDYNAEQWHLELRKLVECNGQPALEAHFFRNVLDDGVDRRQFHMLRQIRDKLQQLMATQGDLTSRALDSLSGENNTLTNYKTFQDKALKILEQWDPAENRLLSSIESLIKQEIEDLRKKAMHKVDVEVKSHILGKSHPLPTQDEATALISRAESGVKVGLRVLVSDFVAAVRKAATDAWEGRLQTLSSMLSDIQLTTPFLQMEITEALSADAVDFARAIREDTLKSISQDPGTPSLDDAGGRKQSAEERASKAWERTMQQPWLPHQTAQAKLTGDHVFMSPGVQRVVNAVNKLGFLLRAPVTGDAKAPKSQGGSDWAVLRGTFPTTVYPHQLREQLQKSVVNPWLQVLEDESVLSLTAAIEKAGTVARSKVETLLQKRIEELTLQGRPSNTIDMTLVNKMVISRAKCSLLYGAVDELYKFWALRLSVILSKSFRPLEEPVEEQKEEKPVPEADEVEYDF